MESSDGTLFRNSLVILFLIGPATAVSLQFIPAPYGKHRRPGWGPSMAAPLAWFLMESPTLCLTLFLFPFGLYSSNLRALTLISPFLLHYFHRTLIYPLHLLSQTIDRKIVAPPGFPVSMVILGFGFNFLNTYVQTRSISHYEDYNGDKWFWWRFIGGLAVFLGGMAVNIRSDRALIRLKSGNDGYKIPRGEWFEFVSCPNYFGEVVEWLGWALMTWSWAGLGFFLFTCANLVPRARANHTWYLNKFGKNYPKSRKVVIPFLY